MKKRLIKIILWEHFCQVMFVLSAIPGIVTAIKGKGTFVTGLTVGWNFGSAVYWQFYLSARKRCEKWMQLAMQATENEAIDIAKGLVESRMKSAHIDPDRN